MDEKSDRIGVVASDSPAIASLSHTLKKSDRHLIDPPPLWHGCPACAIVLVQAVKPRYPEVNRPVNSVVYSGLLLVL
jgi:hypothetical protein